MAISQMSEINEEGVLVPIKAVYNDLERGRVLQMNGYDYSKYVIIKNLGINESFPSWGAKYIIVDLKDYTQRQEAAHLLKHISEKKNGRIQMYILDETLPEDRVNDIWAKSEKIRLEKIERERLEKMEQDRLIDIGKELYKKHIPAAAKALIVAKRDINDCDYQTDYFNVKTGKIIVLGWSKHLKDDFREFRKHADKIPETKHLLDLNPEYEHREKYSMGRGYYLKAESCYSSGWLIKKVCPYENRYYDEIYISLAERCIFEDDGDIIVWEED